MCSLISEKKTIVCYKKKYIELTPSFNTTEEDIKKLWVKFDCVCIGNVDATILVITYDSNDHEIIRQRIRKHKSGILGFEFDHSHTKFFIRATPFGIINIKTIQVECHEEIVEENILEEIDETSEDVEKLMKESVLDEGLTIGSEVSPSERFRSTGDVLVLTHSPMYFDDRIKRQANSLNVNHNVHLVCRQDSDNAGFPPGLNEDVILVEYPFLKSRGVLASKVMKHFYKVYRLFNGKMEKIVRKVFRINGEMLFFDYLPIYQEVYRNLTVYLNKDGLDKKVKWIVANDVFMLPIASRVQRYILKETGNYVNIIGDMHEMHFLYEAGTPLNQEMRKWLCHTYLGKCGLVISVSKQGMELYEEAYYLREAEYIYNAPDKEELEPSLLSEKVQLVHIGGASPERGLEFMIHAMMGLPSHFELSFYLTYNHSTKATDYLNSLKALIVELNLEKRVFIYPPLRSIDLVKVINQYDIGVFYLKGGLSGNYKYAMPNKLFQYIQARLGVVVSDYGEMARVVRDHDVGVVPEDYSLEAYNRAILEVADDLYTYKENAHEAAGVLHGTNEWSKLIKYMDNQTTSARAKG